MIPVQRVQPDEDPHLIAVLRAYELVEAVQDRDVTAQIERLAEEAEAAGWGDVRLLMHMARSLASLQRTYRAFVQISSLSMASTTRTLTSTQIQTRSSSPTRLTC